jgi:hypothetical protein
MTQRRTNLLESGSISDADRIGYERVAGRDRLEITLFRWQISKRNTPNARFLEERSGCENGR